MNLKNQINIFIVDDNKVFALALKAFIENAFASLPINIQSFETGEKCMKKVGSEKPHIVILDYHLNSESPDAFDGITVLNLIKKENNETNVIMLTGEDDLDIALKSFHLGASDYVVKSPTQFKKINYSLINLLKTIEAKNHAKSYKRQVIIILMCFALLLGIILANKIF